MESYKLIPIGIVINDISEENKPEEWYDVISEIRIFSSYTEALLGIEQFKKILVVFWFHQAADTKLKVHPRGDTSRPMRGAFATRTQYRPNKLAVTEVELLGVKGNVLKVKGLDAYNGTPVIDIKSTDQRYNNL